MTNPHIFAGADTEANAAFNPQSGFHSNVVVTGEHLQLIWAKLEPDGNYALHTHEHEQVSLVIRGRMRLTVGDDIREVGPGDMWYAPANVAHGGEVLGSEPVVFVDIYGPPSSSIAAHVDKLRAESSD